MRNQSNSTEPVSRVPLDVYVKRELSHIKQVISYGLLVLFGVFALLQAAVSSNQGVKFEDRWTKVLNLQDAEIELLQVDLKSSNDAHVQQALRILRQQIDQAEKENNQYLGLSDKDKQNGYNSNNLGR